MTLEERLKEIEARANAAHRHICDLAKWEMCIPVQSTDSDIALQAPIDDSRAMLRMLRLAIRQRNLYAPPRVAETVYDRELLEAGEG